MQLRSHNALAAVLRHTLVRAGAFVDRERVVPELCAVREDGSRVDAILDLVVRWPGLGSETLVDVSIRSAHAERYTAAASVPADAASDGEGSKRGRYGPAVDPLIVEACGRVGPGGLATLARLRYEAAVWGGRGGFDLRRLRLEVEASVLREESGTILLALGAGAAAFGPAGAGFAAPRAPGEGGMPPLPRSAVPSRAAAIGPGVVP